MGKKTDFLDLDTLDTEVMTRARKSRQSTKDGKVASPAAKMFSKEAGGGNILERTMRRRDEQVDLQQQVESLKQQLSNQAETISLKMPISGFEVQFKKMWLNPDLIDVSEENQREQSLLDMSAVADIFDSIKSEGQSEPGFVRPTAGGRFELVSGSRRLYCTKNIADRSYLALVGDIPDVDVRRLSRLENQQTPISVYERAISFMHDVESKRIKTWEALAALEGLSERQIKKYKALADLPIEIVRSFGSPSDLSLEFADWLIAKIRRSETTRQKLIHLALDLYRDKQNRIKEGGSPRSTLEIMTEYKSALRVKSSQPTIKKPLVYKERSGREVLKHSISSKGTHKFELIGLDDDKIQTVMNILVKELGVTPK